MKTKYLVRYRFEKDQTRFFETQIECHDLNLPNELFEFLSENPGTIIQKIVRNG